MPAPSLRELQGLFWRALVDPEATEGVLPLVAAGRLPARARLGIYAGMYRARLLDALRRDFPRVAAVLGDEAFAALAEDYLAAHPSSHPSLRHLGGELPAFIAAGSSRGLPPFLADLARLEWARVEVFDAPDRPPLSLDDLRSVPAAGWAELRFALVPAVRLLAVDWPVHRVWAGEAEPGALAPGGVALRVWREGFLVYQAAMDPPEAEALGRLAAGEPFGACCEGLDDPEAAARLLLRWLGDGLLAPT
jgi:hypothetical protein